MKNIATNYEKDFHAWTLENAALLRQRRFAEIDVDNIAEELENMGRSERHELINRLAVLNICPLTQKQALDNDFWPD